MAAVATITQIINGGSGLWMVAMGAVIARSDRRLRGLGLYLAAFGVYLAVTNGLNLAGIGAPEEARAAGVLWLFVVLSILRLAACIAAVTGLGLWLRTVRLDSIALAGIMAVTGFMAVALRADLAHMPARELLPDLPWLIGFWTAHGATVGAVRELALRDTHEAGLAGVVLGIYPAFLAGQLGMLGASSQAWTAAATFWSVAWLTMVVAALAWLARRPYIGLALLAVMLAGILSGPVLGAYGVAALGVARIVAMALLAVVLVRHRVPEFDGRMHVVVRGTAHAATFLAAVLLAAAALRDLLSGHAPWVGLLGGAVTVVLFAPFAERFADDALATSRGRQEIYRRALADAVRDRRRRPAQEARLARLAGRLGLTPDEVAAIRAPARRAAIPDAADRIRRSRGPDQAL